jgi:O-antigen/teichoic acid export membrane protein
MAASVQDDRRDLATIILRNTLVASAGSWLTRIVNFLFIIYVVRMLGEVDLGRYATVVAFVGLFSVFSELGLAQYVERSIAQDHKRAQDLFWNLVALRAILASAGIVGITLGAFALYDRELAFGVLLFSLTFVLSALLVPLTIMLTANERFDMSTALNLMGQLLTIALGLLVLWMGLGIYALLLTGFVTMPFQILVAVLLIRRARLGPIPFRVQPRSWSGFVRASLPFGLTSLALTFNFNVERLFWACSDRMPM